MADKIDQITIGTSSWDIDLPPDANIKIQGGCITNYLTIYDDGAEDGDAPRPTNYMSYTDPDIYIYSTGFTVCDADQGTYSRYSFPKFGGQFVTASGAVGNTYTPIYLDSNCAPQICAHSGGRPYLEANSKTVDNSYFRRVQVGVQDVNSSTRWNFLSATESTTAIADGTYNSTIAGKSLNLQYTHEVNNGITMAVRYGWSHYDANFHAGVISATSFYASSDRRLKENIVDPSLNYRKLIKQIPLRQFNYISAPNLTLLGPIAQDVEKILPDSLRKGLVLENDYKTINEGKIHYLTMGAVQELDTEVERLKAENEELKARLARLEALLIK